ncbi:hypothetical protein BD626DRAFT_276054 [Schizophyllum amplum]|uniref:Uncharacterized protein n=1 Tax=Schizophyllum amplum TaxID=97359 RepID=A0A550CFZ6_9AGAR|nr:hypothetical protein BD626DRAFT_276054 [Auriculariopsis ampla]
MYAFKGNDNPGPPLGLATSHSPGLQLMTATMTVPGSPLLCSSTVSLCPEMRHVLQHNHEPTARYLTQQNICAVRPQAAPRRSVTVTVRLSFHLRMCILLGHSRATNSLHVQGRIGIGRPEAWASLDERASPRILPVAFGMRAFHGGPLPPIRPLGPNPPRRSRPVRIVRDSPSEKRHRRSIR